MSNNNFIKRLPSCKLIINVSERELYFNDFDEFESKRVLAKVSDLNIDTRSEDMFVSHSYSNQLINNLNALRKDSKFCDVEISVQNETFTAHKAVLSASSPYFRAMFNNGLIENDRGTVKLHSLSSHIFEIMLDFIYIGTIRITRDNCQELTVAADMLQLTDLVKGCMDFFKKELHITNAIGICRFADHHNFKDLTSEALMFLQENFPRISLEEEFLELSKESVVELLSSEYLHVDGEVQVLQAAMRWIHYKIEERRSFIFKILGNVRFPLIAKTTIEQAILYCEDSSVKIALRSIWKDLLLKNGNLSPLVVQPRLHAKKYIFIIGGSKREMISTWSRSSECTSVEKFDIFKQCWSSVSPMRIGRILPGVTTLNGKIFVFGGEQESQILANGECYDPIVDEWSPVSSMIEPRCEFGLTALNGYLYAVGGWIGEDIGDSIERYDPVSDVWKLVGRLDEQRFSMGVVSYEGLIYIVGGCTHNSRYHTSLLSYNPVTNEWETLAPMMVPRSQMGVVVFNDHLYVVGGTNKARTDVLHSVEKYSFKENKWYALPSMIVKRCLPAVAAVDGVLYVMGGDQLIRNNFYRTQITLNSMEKYDPAMNMWQECPSLLEKRSEAGSVVF